jgi:hypothetical protein
VAYRNATREASPNMSATEYGVNHPLAIKHWEPKLMKETLKKTHALQFMGKGKDALCTIKTDLTVSKATTPWKATKSRWKPSTKT